MFYLLYIILAILIITTAFVVVRTILYQRSKGAVEKIEGVPVDDRQVAEHLAKRSALPDRAAG